MTTIKLHGEELMLGTFTRPAGEQTILYLHGLGSTSADFAPLADSEVLAPWTLEAIDFPGCGSSTYPSRALTVEDLADVALAYLDARNIEHCAIVGHSLGGAAGLLLATLHPERVDCFVNVEGNLTGDDCRVLSRRVVEGVPIDELIENFARHELPSIRRFASTFHRNVTGRACVDYCRSLVELSDAGQLLEQFLSLTVPKAFIYGSANADLPYLPRLRESGMPVIEIPNAHHWPMADDLPRFSAALAELLSRSGDAAVLT